MRILVLCSVLLLVLTTSNGCYTVFRTTSLDGKPPAEVPAYNEGQSSADMAYDTYEHDRWRFYLACPWWYHSLWFPGDDEAIVIDGPDYGDWVVPASPIEFEIPGIALPVYIPVEPAQISTSPETKYKTGDDSADSGSKNPPEKTTEKKGKPVRRTNGG